MVPFLDPGRSMNFTDFQEFFFIFYRLIVFLGLAIMLVSAAMLGVLNIFRVFEQA